MSRAVVLAFVTLLGLLVPLDFTAASALQPLQSNRTDRSLFYRPPPTPWSLENRIPMTSDNAVSTFTRTEYKTDSDSEEELEEEEGRAKLKKKLKKFKKFLLPLLLAYKLKFFTLIPLIMGGLILLTGATGLSGFFFALFAATMGLKTHGHY